MYIPDSSGQFMPSIQVLYPNENQSQSREHLMNDRGFNPESNSSRSGSFASLESPEKQAVSSRGREFAPS